MRVRGKCGGTSHDADVTFIFGFKDDSFSFVRSLEWESFRVLQFSGDESLKNGKLVVL